MMLKEKDMSRKRNPHGTRIQRENALASALGLGTGRTMMGALLSSYESGARIIIEFTAPGATVPSILTAQLPADLFVPVPSDGDEKPERED